ncbi:hypothetical protein D920_00699 [Enterococcus faecalis 13-SD-W-01]|nr:hypothetical protein D920_00699 [Enterococcus faecalis 13-SD-W-01]
MSPAISPPVISKLPSYSSYTKNSIYVFLKQIKNSRNIIF